MEIIKTPKEMQNISKELRKNGKIIAVVPTMGYLHPGHISLVNTAHEHSDTIILTSFVNPTQFGPNEDFQTYPRDNERDVNIALSAGVDYFFNPDALNMYPLSNKSSITIPGISDKFDGIKRPGHFNGVATIVAKLFNATQPDIAVFGQKDYQQTLVIKHLVKDFLFDIKIVISPTLREEDGLAMSSRNVYLSQDERIKATIIYKSLNLAIEAIQQGEKRRKIINAIMHNSLRSVDNIMIDYASAATADNLDEPDLFYPEEHVVLLIAAFIGKTRLIDNALVTIPKE